MRTQRQRAWHQSAKPQSHARAGRLRRPRMRVQLTHCVLRELYKLTANAAGTRPSTSTVASVLLLAPIVKMRISQSL